MGTVISASSIGNARSREGVARSVFRWVHLWVGLSLGLILAVQGLTGSVLVWRPELDRVMAPALTHAEGPGRVASLDQERGQVLAAAEGGKVRMVRLASVPGGTDEWSVTFAGNVRETVYGSPATGRVLGVRGGKRDALQWLIELHHTLLMGEAGRSVLGVVGVGTVVLALTGIWLWWPKRWMPSRFRPRAAARPLHYAVGFWTMWPLLAIALTGIFFAWRQPIQRMFGVAGPQMQHREEGGGLERHRGAVQQNGAGANGAGNERAHGEGHAKVSLDAVIAAAQAAQPGARMTGIRFPEEGGAYTVMFERGRHYRASPDSMTVMGLPDGGVKVARVTLWEQQPAKKRFFDWLPRVHQAEFGGVAVRLLWMVTGWMPVVLYVSGFLMWRRRVRMGVSLL